MSLFTLFLSFCILCYTSISSDHDVIQPTVINATGEYYIADKTSFSYNRIHCNSTRNCYIICAIVFSCSNTVISCSSSICYLECTNLESCFNTNFNINTDPIHANTFVNVLCSDSYACYNTHIYAIASTAASSMATFSLFTYATSDRSTLSNSTFIIQHFTSVNINHNSDDSISNVYRLLNVAAVNILKEGDDSYGYNVSGVAETFIIYDSNTVNMTCKESNACAYDRLLTNHSSNSSSSAQTTITTINCIGYKACRGLEVKQSTYDQLELFCIEGHSVCLGASLFVSPQKEATYITCNGTKDSNSCKDVSFIVPYYHQHAFVSTVFVNHDSNDTIAHTGSFDGVRINCLMHELCTNYTSFPLLYGAAAASYLNKTVNNKVYFEGSAAYEYQFKSISCNYGEECHINCKGQKCANTLIQCKKGSVCHIYCAAAYDCDHITLQAFSDSIELVCGAMNACYDASIWLPQSFNNGFLNISTCNKYESCHRMTFMCGDYNQFISSEFKFNDDRYLCADEACCPWNNTQDETFKCTQDDCVIDCDNEFGNPYAQPIGCTDLVIDGSASKYLSVNCSAADKCGNMTVLCASDACDIYCGKQSCVNATIQVKHTRNINMHCADVYSCSGAHIVSYDTDHFMLNCSDSMSCYDVSIYSNISVNMTIKCDVNNGCRGLNVDSHSAHNLHVMCTKDDACGNNYIKGSKNGNVSLECYGSNACDSIKMDIDDVNNVDIICRNRSCLYNIFNVSHVANSVNLTCADTHACSSMQFSAKYVNRSVSLKCLNRYSCSDTKFQANYVNDSVDIFCNAQYSCKGSLDAQHANRLNIHKYSSEYYGNYAMNIKAPKKAKSVYIYCKQFGCNELDLETMNGLCDVEAMWSGNCYSDNIVDHVTEWRISCGESEDAEYYGNYCSGNDNCCSQKDVKSIKKAFDKYYYYGNGDISKACAVAQNEEASHTGRTAAIVIVVIIVMALIGCVAYNWYQKTDCWRFICFLVKQKVKKPRQPSEEYLSINSIN